MSVLVAGLCYEATFGCAKRKSIVVALADHASHDGGSVFPSVALLARKTEYSERTVQRTLRDLEQIGIIEVVSAGGQGPKDTREWRFNMHLLRALAAGTAKIVDDMGDSESPLEGDSLTPLSGLRVTGFDLRVTESTPKGDSSDTRTIKNHQNEPSCAGARATQGAARPLGSEEPRLITREDIEWRAWVSWLTTKGQEGALRAFEAEGAMVVFGKPSGGAMPKLAPKVGSEKREALEKARRGEVVA